MTQKAEKPIWLVVGIFLLCMIIFILACLYLDLRLTNSKLEKQVVTLTEQQIILVADDDQAQLIGRWLDSTPSAMQSLLNFAEPGAEVDVAITPEQQKIDKINALQQQRDMIPKYDAIPMDPSVNVVPLESGGVIITTRDVNE